jgi:hypothetical protein
MNACPRCEGTITGTDGTTFSTAVGVNSPPGHRHDDNCMVKTYWCENGHRFAVSIRRRCGVTMQDGTVCPWLGKASCDTCGGEKVDAWPVVHPVQWPPVERLSR